MFLIAVEGCHEVISLKIIPADWALPPETGRTLVEVALFLFMLRLFNFEFRLVQ